MKANGIPDCDALRLKIKSRRFFGIGWDNLVLSENKYEDTLLNHTLLSHHTSMYVHMLHIPPLSLNATSVQRTAFLNILKALQENMRQGKVGIPKSLLFKEQLDYDSIKPMDLLFGKEIAE